MRRTPAIVLAAGLFVAGLLAACDGRAAAPLPGGAPFDGVVRDGRHVVTAGRGDLSTADFELASGVTTLVLRTGDTGDDLYRVSTPDGAGQLPAVVVSAGHVVAQLVSSGVNGPSLVDVLLSDAVAWSVHLDGGATTATVDASAGGLASLDFGAGISRIDATLADGTVGGVGGADRKGTVSVRMGGGASEFTVHAPRGVPARVSLTGGAGTAVIDGVTHTGIAGGTVYTPDGWDSADPRIDVDNTAGVSTFTLVRY